MKIAVLLRESRPHNQIKLTSALTPSITFLFFSPPPLLLQVAFGKCEGNVSQTCECCLGCDLARGCWLQLFNISSDGSLGI